MHPVHVATVCREYNDETGITHPRIVIRFQGATAKKGMVSADAVNISPSIKRAVVTVRGLLGGTEFEVTRTRTPSKSVPLVGGTCISG
jgi:hypothetical protein